MQWEALVYKRDEPIQSTRVYVEAETDKEAFDLIVAQKPADYAISYYGPARGTYIGKGPGL